MKICFLDTIGLSYDGSTLEKKGLGGSESAVIYMSRYLAELGLDVTVFCKCEVEGIYNNVKYYSLERIYNNTETFDVLISSRNCVPFVPSYIAPEVIQTMGFNPADYKELVSRSNYKIVWMHDLFCVGDLWLETLLVEGYVDELFTLTDWHSHFVSSTAPEYGNIKKDARRYDVLKDKIYQTRNGVFNHLGEIDIYKKDRDKFVYNASISKGMEPLLDKIWLGIKEQLPDSKLTVIGGYYRFPWNDGPDEFEEKWLALKEKYDGKYGIHFTGVIPQKEIAEELATASFFIYPNSYRETFGISTLESIIYNCPVITMENGALEEIADDSVCYKIPYDIDYNNFQIDRFIQLVVEARNNERVWQQKAYRCNAFKEWVGWDKVAYLWKQHLYSKMGFFNFVEHEKKAREIQSNLLRLFNRRHINQEDKYLDYSLDEKKRKIVFVSPVYNAERTIEVYVHSIASQLYQNYSAYLIDDCSTDGTAEKFLDVLKGFPSYIQDKFHLIRNKQRVGSALGNQVEMLSKLIREEDGSNTIIALLDGDDWLYNNPDICSLINHEYDRGAKITYGSFYSLIDNINLIAQPYPKKVHEERSYRQYRFPWNVPYTHLRTFLLEEFKKVSIDNLKDRDGNYYRAGGDISLLYELFENVDNPEESIKPIYDILCVYNDKNPLCDFKVNSEEQTMNAESILNNRKSISHKAREKDKESVELVKKENEERTGVWIDNSNTLMSSPRIAKVIELIEKNFPLERESLRILDLGSWTGGIANLLYSRGYKNITCVDINKEVIEVGKNTYPYFKWEQSDVERYTPSGLYDIILTCEILEHIENPLTFLERMTKSLKNDGKIIFSMPDENHVYDDDNPEHISSMNESDFRVFTKDISKLFIRTDNYSCDFYIGTIPKKINILVAVPTAKYIESETFKSVYNLDKRDNWNVDVQFFYGYRVDQVRNLIADYTVKGNYDYVLTVDSDMVLPSNTLTSLLDRNKGIVSGVYLKKELDKKIPEMYGGEVVDENGQTDYNWIISQHGNVVPIYTCGFGCVLIKREVLEKIGYPWFEYHTSYEFKDSISEDTDFCLKALDKGYKIYLDTNVLCEHIGSFLVKL